MSKSKRKHRKKHNITYRKSYSPTVNRALVPRESNSRQSLIDCNNKRAFKLKEPLQISVHNKCYPYYHKEAIQFLLRNLAANKHIDPEQIIPPIQAQSNCWFNAMFVTFFVSDKGRKFFHFLRQLMIEGVQQDGSTIPPKLRTAFALLNFGVDACLTGNEFAYELNTNRVIHQIYKSIPSSYKASYPAIVDVDKAGNPVLYYIGMINYLQNESIQMLFMRACNPTWRDDVMRDVQKREASMPHVIVLEFFEEVVSHYHDKPKTFSINGVTYALDSAVVRDVDKQHFCATITCEGKEYGYDGASFHRLVPMKWKSHVNHAKEWSFEGTHNMDGTLMKWSFTKSYQLLMYYRI
ncbi:MAG: hypothetical protein ACOVRN_00905 [Flavobacterium sp.]